MRAEGGGYIIWDSRERPGTSEDPGMVITYTSGGTAAPEIAVLGNGATITDGDTTPKHFR